MNCLTKIISVNSRHPYLLTDGYTLVSVSSSSGNCTANQFPAGAVTMTSRRASRSARRFHPRLQYQAALRRI